METPIDTRRAEAFARRMACQLNEAMLALMTGIAHRTGLFEAMAGLPPSTSRAIANAAGLNERYVREWLAAMVTGRIVDYDGARGTYALPREHAASLTRGAGTANLAGRARWVAALAQLESAVVDCFRRGEGLPPEAFAPLRELEADEAREDEANLIATLLARLPEIVARLEAGIDVLHIHLRLHRQHEAVPVTRLMRQRFPRSRHLEARALAEAPTGGEHDLVIAWDALREHEDPAHWLHAVHASLRPSGHLLCVETAVASNLADNLTHPMGPALYATSAMRTLPASDASRGALDAVSPWGEERATQMLAEAGFGPVLVRPLGGADTLKSCLVARKP